jgi:hypothetical protein
MLEAILKSPKNITHTLVDGFPRSKENIDAWNKVVGA